MTRLIDVKSFGTKSVGFEIELFQISVPRKIKTRGMYKAYIRSISVDTIE